MACILCICVLVACHKVEPSPPVAPVLPMMCPCRDQDDQYGFEGGHCLVRSGYQLLVKRMSEGTLCAFLHRAWRCGASFKLLVSAAARQPV